MIYYDVINWNIVHATQIAVALTAILNIFLVRRECRDD